MPQLDSSNAIVPGPTPAQIVTLSVGRVRSGEDTAAVRWILGRVGGVEGVDADRDAARVWVFGDGTVEPMTLVDELASCGFGAVVLGHELQILQ